MNITNYCNSLNININYAQKYAIKSDKHTTDWNNKKTGLLVFDPVKHYLRIICIFAIISQFTSAAVDSQAD